MTALKRRDLNRSPGHPAFDLERAVELLLRVHRQAQFSYVSHETAVELCGYRSSSSTGNRAISALIQFGLLLEKGTGVERRVRLSDLGKRVVLGYKEGSDDYGEALGEAALSPTVYGRLWDEWAGQLPPDSAIRHFLLVELDFNPNTVDSVVDDYRSSMAFAGLLRATEAPQTSGRSVEAPGMQGGGAASAVPEDPFSLAFTLHNGKKASLTLPMPMTAADFELLESLMATYLGHMRKAGQPNGGEAPKAVPSHQEIISPLRPLRPRGAAASRRV